MDDSGSDDGQTTAEATEPAVKTEKGKTKPKRSKKDFSTPKQGVSLDQKGEDEEERTLQQAAIAAAQAFQRAETARAQSKSMPALKSVAMKAPGTPKKGQIGPHGLREDWVVDSLIEQAYQRIKVWRHPKTGKRETPLQNEKRMVLNLLIKDSLHKYPTFYDDVLEGDNYTIVRNVLSYTGPNSRKMLMDIQKKLYTYRKTRNRGYQDFERGLRDIHEQLAMLGRPVSREDKTLHLLTAMMADDRYKEKVDKLCDDDSPYHICHNTFMREADRIRNMWSENTATDTTISVNAVDSKKKDRHNNNKNNSRSHESEKKNGKEKKGGRNRGGTGNDKTQQACPFFLARGRCRNGDNCPLKHMTLKEFTALKEKDQILLFWYFANIR